VFGRVVRTSGDRAVGGHGHDGAGFVPQVPSGRGVVGFAVSHAARWCACMFRSKHPAVPFELRSATAAAAATSPPKASVAGASSLSLKSSTRRGKRVCFVGRSAQAATVRSVAMATTASTSFPKGLRAGASSSLKLVTRRDRARVHGGIGHHAFDACLAGLAVSHTLGVHCEDAAVLRPHRPPTGVCFGSSSGGSGTGHHAFDALAVTPSVCMARTRQSFGRTAPRRACAVAAAVPAAAPGSARAATVLSGATATTAPASLPKCLRAGASSVWQLATRRALARVHVSLEAPRGAVRAAVRHGGSSGDFASEGLRGRGVVVIDEIEHTARQRVCFVGRSAQAATVRLVATATTAPTSFPKCLRAGASSAWKLVTRRDRARVHGGTGHQAFDACLAVSHTLGVHGEDAAVLRPHRPPMGVCSGGGGGDGGTGQHAFDACLAAWSAQAATVLSVAKATTAPASFP